ncbi:hypothetical protein C8R45DRAFT_1082609 [Mycena sanguinolenta]|nr:hypothetical protein C8R45DRAFT_1082609 [Mycena sanguinolenta]
MRTSYDGHEEIADVDDGGAGREDGVGNTEAGNLHPKFGSARINNCTEVCRRRIKHEVADCVPQVNALLPSIPHHDNLHHSQRDGATKKGGKTHVVADSRIRTLPTAFAEFGNRATVVKRDFRLSGRKLRMKMPSVSGVRFGEQGTPGYLRASWLALSSPTHNHYVASSSLPISNMKRIREFLGRSKTRASSAPPSSRVPDPSAPSLTTLTRPASPQQTAPAPLPRESPLSASQTAWTNLKEVLNALRDGSDLHPPLKAALTGVTSVMAPIDRVGNVNNEFLRISENVKGFQGIFWQYIGGKDITPAVHTRLDALISELKLIEEAIGSKSQTLHKTRHIVEEPGEVEEIMIAFKRFSNIIDKLQFLVVDLYCSLT